MWGGAGDVERIFYFTETTSLNKFKNIIILTLPSHFIYENLIVSISVESLVDLIKIAL